MVNEFQTTNLDLQSMAKLVGEIERLRHDFQPMPDSIMDHLTNARFALAEMVMKMPASGMVELSAKLRMMADTNRDEASFEPSLPGWIALIQREVGAL